MAERRDTQNQGSPGSPGLPSGREDSPTHPVATGIGALGGAAAGVATGAMAGPVGSVVGAVAGAVVGGLGGSAVGRTFDPAVEDRYWRANYANEPYYEAGRSYDDYGPAYTLGMTGRITYGGRFDQAEPQLSQAWEQQRGGSRLSWEQARKPSRAAWQRIDTEYPTTGDGQLMGSGRTVSGSSAEADLGTGSTYSSRSSLQGDDGNTVRASGLKDLGGAVGSANRAERVDIRSGEDASVSGLSRSKTPDFLRSRDHALGAFGAVGSAQSASAGKVSHTDDVVNVLNDLVECCRDGEYSFSLCAEHAQSPDIRQRLSERAGECRSAARDLMDHIRQLGGAVDDGGSMMGSMHRGWVSVKGTLVGYSDRAMLTEAERGEDAALGRYRKALKENLPPEVRALVQRQAEGVQRNHDEIKRWRDSLQDRR